MNNTLLLVIEWLAMAGSLCFSFSLYPRLIPLAKSRGDSGELLSPFVPLLMAWNGVNRIVYGTMITDIPILVLNFIGFFNCSNYVLWFIRGIDKNYKWLISQYLYLAILTSTFIMMSLFYYFGVEVATIKKIFGSYSTFTSIAIYVAPIMAAVDMIKLKTSAPLSIPWTCVAMFVSSGWSIYGIGRKDVFIWSPNVVGVILAVFQLILICVLPRKAVKIEETELEA